MNATIRQPRRLSNRIREFLLMRWSSPMMVVLMGLLYAYAIAELVVPKLEPGVWVSAVLALTVFSAGGSPKEYTAMSLGYTEFWWHRAIALLFRTPITVVHVSLTSGFHPVVRVASIVGLVCITAVMLRRRPQGWPFDAMERAQIESEQTETQDNHAIERASKARFVTDIVRGTRDRFPIAWEQWGKLLFAGLALVGGWAVCSGILRALGALGWQGAEDYQSTVVSITYVLAVFGWLGTPDLDTWIRFGLPRVRWWVSQLLVVPVVAAVALLAAVCILPEITSHQSGELALFWAITVLLFWGLMTVTTVPRWWESLGVFVLVAPLLGAFAMAAFSEEGLTVPRLGLIPSPLVIGGASLVVTLITWVYGTWRVKHMGMGSDLLGWLGVDRD